MSRRGALAVVALICVSLFPPAAQAAGWHYYDPDCPIALGSKSMKFVAMQPKRNIDRICDQLPDTGPTVVALDAPDAELREMNWDIRILRDSGAKEGEEDVENATVFRLPTEKHRNGMVNFDHSFQSADKYLLLIRLTSDDGATEYVGRHRFTVGLMVLSDFLAYLALGGCLLAAGGGFAYVAWRRKRARPGG
ncbi:MAG TPA: hypothetical protein VK446_10370 [Methylocystis sp.]|nr:hypothetical protein [Methylocystis sp.]